MEKEPPDKGKRITPAYAGKSHSVLIFGRCFRDHPRVCGEKTKHHNAVRVKIGSPPRMRGKVTLFPKKSVFWMDHPRVCGEKPHNLNLPSKPIGSPPRMRGKVWRWQEMSADAGITPAYAGKSCRPSQTRRHYWDHPRVCGEK